MSTNPQAVVIPTLIECFSDVSDPRIERCRRHKLIHIIVIAMSAVVTEAELPAEMATFGEAKEDWLRQFMELPHGIT